MELNNRLIDKNYSFKEFSISNYDIALGSSMISNVCCNLRRIHELLFSKFI